MLLVRIECNRVIFYPQRPLLSVNGTDMLLIPLTNIIAIVRVLGGFTCRKNIYIWCCNDWGSYFTQRTFFVPPFREGTLLPKFMSCTRGSGRRRNSGRRGLTMLRGNVGTHTSIFIFLLLLYSYPKWWGPLVLARGIVSPKLIGGFRQLVIPISSRD